MAYLASVEVDQRQTFIHQADTLQADRNRLADCAAELRHVIEADGLGVSVAIVERSADYEEDVLKLEFRIRTSSFSRAFLCSTSVAPRSVLMCKTAQKW
jgi:hypothetical protein